ncbi:MAG: hypothetical protein LBO07_03950 [Coriobacteriales bacterium]|jgi:Ca2+/Na+ antiporter|nr:hypothetical protein [Coriobacteriales bacterium]
MLTFDLFGNPISLVVDLSAMYWSLADLILLIVAVLVALVFSIRFALTQHERRSVAPLVFGIIAMAVNVIIFFATQELSWPMAILDLWTLLMLSILTAEIVCLVLSTRRRSAVRRESEDSFDDEDLITPIMP